MTKDIKKIRKNKYYRIRHFEKNSTIEDFGKLKNVGNKIVSGVKSLGKKIESGVKTGVKAIVDTGKKVGDFAVSTVNKALSVLDITKILDDIINRIKNPIIDTFKRAFSMDFIKRELEKIGSTIKNTFEQPILNAINLLKSQLESLFAKIGSGIESLIRTIPKLLKSILDGIKNLYSQMENVFNKLKTDLINVFSSFGRMILTITDTVKDKMLKISKEVISVFDDTIKKIAEFSNMLISAGSEFIIKYVKGPVLYYFDGFIKIILNLYEYIKTRLLNSRSDTSFMNCLPVMANQLDDVFWKMSPLLAKFYLKNQEITKPQCKKQFLIDMLNGRIFIENNKVISLITIMIGYIIIQQMLKYLSNNTKDLIPNYLLILFTLISYAQFVSSNISNRENLITFYSNLKKFVPTSLITLYKKNYTAFAIFMILLIYQMKLIGEVIYNKSSEQITSYLSQSKYLKILV